MKPDGTLNERPEDRDKAKTDSLSEQHNMLKNADEDLGVSNPDLYGIGINIQKEEQAKKPRDEDARKLEELG